MDELMLLEATDRYLNNEMHADERAHFESMRKNSVEVDQFVVNHTSFIAQLNNAADHKLLIHNIDAARAELITNQDINIDAKPEAKVISIWDRYRKKLAIAATIAALFTLSTVAIVSAYNTTKGQSQNFTEVKGTVKLLENDLNAIKNEVKNIKNTRPFVEANTNGTGFMINESGYIVTNLHVVKNAKELFVYNETFGDLEASVVVSDAANDIAILKINDTAFSLKSKIPYSIKKGDVNLAQQVYTLGYNRPPYLTYNEGSVGSKSANANIAKGNNFLVSLKVDGGNSGSPIFNKEGEIVGIVSAKENQENGYTLGIKTNALDLAFKTMSDQKMAEIKLNNNQIANNSIERQTKKVDPFIFMVKIK